MAADGRRLPPMTADKSFLCFRARGHDVEMGKNTMNDIVGRHRRQSAAIGVSKDLRSHNSPMSR